MSDSKKNMELIDRVIVEQKTKLSTLKKEFESKLHIQEQTKDLYKKTSDSKTSREYQNQFMY